ncbi:heavy metal translocating P-type ATPase [Paenibacillus alginolyticus]|uniref:Cd(2+)-exporting ATPase n=2 Tax=Paenibacillus alginolyticus TaxID=59839 RepID=A0ABT4GJ03_9BACL|nr:heavy metal translocating P-type ATPase [Paenibacillus alginolyticus]MCY9696166.1 cadmium-translocating P-type ATPase [Paenibacillus alginolyticus]MEC0143319.1 heavy metal translocating P-type ATPase [Paenibacillus alginolyticus]
MSEDNENKDSCCSDKKCESNKQPSFKKSLTILHTTSDPNCKEDCCKEEPKELKLKKSFNLVDVSTSQKCEDECCHESPQPISQMNKDFSVLKSDYLIGGMDCPSCALTIEKSVKTIKGISDVQVNYNTGRMKVVYDNEKALDLLSDTVTKLGHTIEEVQKKGKGKVYVIEGMDCSSCAMTIENHLKSLPSVTSVSVNFSTGKMMAEHDISVEDVIKEISKAGYKASLVSRNQKNTVSKKDNSGRNLIVFSGVLLLFGWIGSYTNVSPNFTTLLYAISIIIGGYKPARSAYYAVKSRSLDMNVLMTAAVLGAAAIGQWLEGATVVWLFALGNVLQTMSIEKTRNSIRSLIDLAPPEAFVKIGQELVRKLVEEISVDDVIVIKPGDKIPLDGLVIAGESSINQSAITGESIPIDKHIGDSVFAGTINEHGSLEIKVTKLVEDTTISKIIHLVEEAQEQKAPTEAFVDKFARIYTPIVFILALIVMFLPPLFAFGTWGSWFYKGLELLVIACPCALVISTPVAIVSAIGNAAKNGVLIKGGAFLEIAGRISTIAFDKTGTLTEGKPNVSQVILTEASENELLSIARTLEEYSTHPIAKAVVEYAKDKGVPVLRGETFRNIVGKGISAWIGNSEYFAGNMKLFKELHTSLDVLEPQILSLQQDGNTIVIIGTSEKIIGVIAVADAIRSTSVKALKGLQAVGIHEVVMLTGDNEGTAKKVASETGVTRYFAELMPEDKVNAVKNLQKEGHFVAMVGDGINDAPALATADLGIAMGGAGTDTAMETADIVLMADNLEKLPHTIHLSRKSVQIIKQNIWFSIVIKVVALLLIFPGLLTLWMAVLSDTGAALLVILNSLRLLRLRR